MFRETVEQLECCLRRCSETRWGSWSGHKTGLRGRSARARSPLLITDHFVALVLASLFRHSCLVTSRLVCVRPRPRTFTVSAVQLKRRFTLVEPVKMDMSSLTSRLESLSFSSATADDNTHAKRTALATYFFTPKSGSKHPDNSDVDLKLVVVALEQDKNVGPAKALAGQFGLKDMRAVSAADLDKLVGRSRDQGECDSCTRS